LSESYRIDGLLTHSGGSLDDATTAPLFFWSTVFMKRSVLPMVLVVASWTGGFSSVAHADAALAQAKNCMACHAADRKMVGPSYKDIANRYKDDKGAAAKLAGKIRAGGSGVWGPVPMPANAQVTEAEALRLATWVLTQR
jgi:cytochrome c